MSLLTIGFARNQPAVVDHETHIADAALATRRGLPYHRARFCGSGSPRSSRASSGRSSGSL